MWINIIILILAGITQILPTDEDEKLRFANIKSKLALFILIGVSIVFGIFKEISDSRTQNNAEARLISNNQKIDSLNNIITGIRSVQQIQLKENQEQFLRNINEFDSLNNKLIASTLLLDKVREKQTKSLTQLQEIERINKRADYSIKDSQFEVLTQIPINPKYLSLFSGIERSEITQIQLDSIFQRSFNFDLRNVISIHLDFYICGIQSKGDGCPINLIPYSNTKSDIKNVKTYYFKDGCLYFKLKTENPIVSVSHFEDFSYFDLLDKTFHAELNYQLLEKGVLEAPKISYVYWKIGKNSPIRLQIPFWEHIYSKGKSIFYCESEVCPEVIVYDIELNKKNVRLFEWGSSFME